MEIRDIEIRDLNIPQISNVIAEPTIAVPPTIPVTLQLGTPIVNLPGCVEAHESNNGSRNILEDDPNGSVTFCDGSVPSYDPINFEPERIIPTEPAAINTKTEEKSKPPGQADIPSAAPPATAKVDCPTAAQQAKEPVGTYLEGFRKKVTEYKLIDSQCIQITEAVPLPQQIVAGLPSGGMVMQTGGIALVATTSALLAKPLADILLKVVKPTIKKVMKKIATIRKKQIPVESVKERRDQQRIRSHAIRKLKGKE
jgi:hypothetical protein